VRIGKIARPHGVRGALRIRLDDPDSATLEAVSHVYLSCDGPDREYRLRKVARLGRNAMRIELDQVDTCEAAEALRDAVVSVAEADLPPPAQDQFYSYRAIGCEVTTTDGRRLGNVERIIATGANDVLVVQDGTVELLIPVIADIVKRLDFTSRTITVAPVPGLID
jgi:16S rRNA processing protein RimM